MGLGLGVGIEVGATVGVAAGITVGVVVILFASLSLPMGVGFPIGVDRACTCSSLAISGVCSASNTGVAVGRIVVD